LGSFRYRAGQVEACAQAWQSDETPSTTSPNQRTCEKADLFNRAVRFSARGSTCRIPTHFGGFRASCGEWGRNDRWPKGDFEAF
jgi:hypothetical protein